MNTATAKNFLTLITSKIGIERERLYQLVRAAEHSYYLKDTERQLEIGRILRRYSYPFDQIGKYFEAMQLVRSKDFSGARNLLENVTEYAPDRYRAKALLAIAGVEEIRGNLKEVWEFRAKALTCTDPLIILEAQTGIAILKSLEGDNRRSLKHLENMLPLARLLQGNPAYFDFLNSYAVELGDNGKIKEARQVVNIVLASPYTKHYPNWLETGREIYLRSRPSSRAIISFKGAKTNLLILPISEMPVIKSLPEKPARILSYVKWKKKMVKKPNGDESIPPDATEKDLYLRLMELIAQKDLSVTELRKLINFVENISSKPEKD